MAPLTRTLRSERSSQPRRRTSGSSNPPRREASWDFLENPDAAPSFSRSNDHDAMEIDGEDRDEDLFANEMSSLKDVAERVGKQVELFAEKLDALKSVELDDRHEHDSAEDKEAAMRELKRTTAVELVQEYRSIAEDTVQNLRRKHNVARERDVRREVTRLSRHLDNHHEDDELYEDPLEKTTAQDLREWQSELATWQLLEGIMKCNYPKHTPGTEDERVFVKALNEPGSRFDADGKSWVDFLCSDVEAQEQAVVVRWLETNTEQSGDDLEIIQDEIGNIMGTGTGTWNQGWMETRELLKAEKRMRGKGGPIEPHGRFDSLDVRNSKGTDRIITQLDPDAPTRQNLSLEKGDANMDKSFWMVLWEMLRRGKSMHQIHIWCQEQNEYTKALSIGALEPTEGDLDESKSITSRYRWRRACRRLATCETVNDYQRAVFGLLSGDVQSLQRISTRWEDVVYSRYNALLLKRYEAYIESSGKSPVPPSTHSTLRTPGIDYSSFSTSKKIIESLQMDDRFRLDASDPHKVVQASVLAQDFDQFIFEQGVALSRKAGESPSSSFDLITSNVANAIPIDEPLLSVTENYDALRVIAHMWIIYRELGIRDRGGPHLEAIENVLVAYIEFLLSIGRLNLIPLYASTLSVARGTSTMARTLTSVGNMRDREELVVLMRDNGLKIEKIILMQWQSAMDASPLPKVGNKDASVQLLAKGPDRDKEFLLPRVKVPTTEPVEAHEELLIRSMEWFIFSEVHWASALHCLTRTATLFLRTGRLHAAIELYHRLPFSSVEDAKAKHADGITKTDSGQADSKKKSGNKSGGHSRQKTKSRDVTNHISQHDIFENCALNYVQLGQLVTAIEVLWEWRLAEDDMIGGRSRVTDMTPPARSGSDCIKKLEEAMEPILQDTHFLRVASKDIDAAELEHLRQTYLPEVILAYNSALHVAGYKVSRQNFITSLDLATQVAENENLVACFKATGRMQRLVQDIAQTNTAMLAKVEEDAKGRSTRRQKKQKSGKTLGIWDIKA